MFCAAMPAVAAAGVTLNNKQLVAKREAEANGTQEPAARPVVQVTAGIVVLLMIGSVTYHTLTYLP